FGLSVPAWLLVTAARSATSWRRGGDGVCSTLAQSIHGRWLVGRATGTRDATGAPAGTGVVLESAGPALRAPVLARACGLTEREQEIAQLVARGTGTAQIADALFLSAHTVRDHVKSLLQKVGVCSRGELVATLYTEQARPSDVDAGRGEGLPGPDGYLDRGMAAPAAGHWDEGARRDRARDRQRRGAYRSEHDADHTAPWAPALGRRPLLRAGGALGAAGAAGAVGALTAAPALAGDGVGGTRDRWLRPGDEGYEEAVAGCNTTVTHRPEAVVLAREARDVQQA